MGCFISQLAAKFAFFPPSPATYQVIKRDDGKLIAVPPTTSSTPPIPFCDDDDSLDVLLLDTKRGNRIVAFYLKNPYAKLTLLYSHGNAADLGQLYDLFLQLKANLRVNLIGYDYSGYGASTGTPSEYNTYADIEAVYECLETEYGISQEDLILYGQSVGSGPTLHLAARLPRLRGVVLQSAILSGLRVLCHMKFTLCFDIYRNINKIRKVKCPVLVIHGTEDDVVNWLHGEGLRKMARDPYEPLWIKGGGHCNLELYPDYILHLYRFIQEMENMTTEIRLKKIRQTLHLPYRSNSVSSSSTNRCCRIKLGWKCSAPSCLKCLSRTKCLDCRPKCPDCLRCCIPRRPDCLRCCIPKCPDCLRPGFTMSCCIPKCPDCCIPKCPDCCIPKCPDCCIPKCLDSGFTMRCCIPKFSCIPKCPDCLRPGFTMRCCIPKCPDCCIPKCPDCLRPGITKYSCSVKCSCWCINCPCW